MADFVKVCPKMELSFLIAKLTFCSKIDFLKRRSLFLSCCHWRTWKAAKGQIRPRIDCGWFCQSLSKKSHLVPWLQNWLFESPISLSVLLSKNQKIWSKFWKIYSKISRKFQSKHIWSKNYPLWMNQMLLMMHQMMYLIHQMMNIRFFMVKN